MKVLFRLSIIFLGLVSLIGGISLIIYNISLINQIDDGSIIDSLININIITAIVAFIGLFLSISSLIVIEGKGIKKYQQILNSIDLSKKSISSLSNLNLPEEDELGNLGSKIKVLINMVLSFDEIKKNIIQKQSSMMNYIMENFPHPLIILDYSYDITDVNQSFNKKFHISEPIGKNIFEIINFKDYNLKAQSDSYVKQSEEIYFETSNQAFKAMLNFKRFTNEKGYQEYILIFNDVEIDKTVKTNDDDYLDSYKE